MKLLFFPLLFLPALAQVTIKPKPATSLEIPTKANLFYQLEKKQGEKWVKVEEPFIGDAKPKKFLLTESPETNFRVSELHKQWVPVWRDEFNGTSLDRTKWANEEDGYGGGNKERQYYSAAPKYTVVKDGHLHINLFRDPHTTTDGKTQPYTSSRIRSMNRGEWKYGRFEIRAKMPSGEGIWPAVWMLPTNSPDGIWAASGEIDIIESRGSEVDKTIGTLHFGGQWPKNQHKGGTYKFPGKNAAEDFHIYAVEWEKDEIRWFVDGVKWQTIKKEDWNSTARPDSATAPFDQPFHLVINLAVDGGFFSNTGQSSDKLKAGDFPQTLLIDYIRVFQWAK